MYIPINPKNLNEISAEWDKVCTFREAAICDGKDISLVSVTVPWILKHIQTEKSDAILDVGCGTGYLTNQLSSYAKICIGIDVSRISLDIARKNYQQDNLNFIESSISQFTMPFAFDICVSNMVFMSDPHFGDSLKDIFRLLSPHGKLLCMISHPCFWPFYCNFFSEPWFNYEKEQFLEHNFATSLAPALGNSTYIHRPLSQYLDAFISAGFVIESIEEPYPLSSNLPSEYNYKYPRFLFIKCRKP